MITPWDVLGVPPGCSAAELRAAYARLLKQHRPDTDPEGFRRVRDAYEYLRAHGTEAPVPLDDWDADDFGPDTRFGHEVEWQPTPTPDDTAAATPPTDSPGRHLLDPHLQRLRRGLRHALDHARIHSVGRFQRALVHQWRNREPTSHDLDVLLQQELRRDPVTMRQQLEPADALRAARAGDPRLARLLIEAHVQAADELAAQRLAEACAESCARLPCAEIAAAAVQIADACALVQVGLAERLANLAFPLLRGSTTMGRLDALLRAGGEVARRPASDRLLLARLLQSTHPVLAEDLAAAGPALRRLAGAAPVLTRLLSDQFPEHRAAFQPPPTASHTRTRTASRQNVGGSVVWLIVGWFLLRALLVAFTR